VTYACGEKKKCNSADAKLTRGRHFAAGSRTRLQRAAFSIAVSAPRTRQEVVRGEEATGTGRRFGLCLSEKREVKGGVRKKETREGKKRGGDASDLEMENIS